MALARGSDEDIVAFANKNGPLFLCREHGLPMTHISQRSLRFLPDEAEAFASDHSVAVAMNRLAVTEPIDRWRTLIRQAKAIADVAAHAWLNELAPTETWLPLYPLEAPAEYLRQDHLIDWLANQPRPTNALLPAHPAALFRKAFGELTSRQRDNDNQRLLGEQRRSLALAVQTLLDWSDVGVHFTWGLPELGSDSASASQIRVGANSLFGTLALQIAEAVGRVKPVAICASCGKIIFRLRSVPAGRQAWCNDNDACRKDQTNRAVQRSRAKGRANKSSTDCEG